MESDQVRFLLERLDDLGLETYSLEKKLRVRVNEKVAVLTELREYGLEQVSDFKTYLDEHPEATPPRQLARRSMAKTETKRRDWKADCSEVDRSEKVTTW